MESILKNRPALEHEIYQVAEVAGYLWQKGWAERGKLINGKVFDSTQQGRPATFKLNQLIDGWRTALREMPVGSRWEIVIPFNLGYGAKGAGVIKPFSTLIFDVRLISIG